MKFLVDSMLGKLSRWLRMLGQDVVYSTELTDFEILDVAKRESRILLTKDLELYKRAMVKEIESFYVEGETEEYRLAGLAQRYALSLVIEMEKSNCPLCNTKLEATPKSQLINELEKNTFIHYDQFWKCPHCGQIYWQGAHWKQITNTLNEAKEILVKLRKKEA